MVEGHHFGADEHREEQRVPWEKKELSSPSTISLGSGNESLVIKTKGVLTFSDFFFVRPVSFFFVPKTKSYHGILRYFGTNAFIRTN